MDGIRHTGIVVTDLARALHFYKDLLGLRVVKRKYEKGNYIDTVSGLRKVKVTTVKMAAKDGNLIELLYFSVLPKFTRIKKFNSQGISHIAFSVRNIENEYNRLSKKGIRFNSLPQVSPDHYAKVAFCRDPEGVFIELVEVLRKK